MCVICASSACQVRVNLVPESARHLQMTRTRQMRVICVRVRVIYQRPNYHPRYLNPIMLLAPTLCSHCAPGLDQLNQFGNRRKHVLSV